MATLKISKSLVENIMKQKKNKIHLLPDQIIVLGFLCVIAVGSILLTLPIATQDGSGTGIMDAAFTATSAVCVTGLVVHNTATYWSMFGQFVIICLIQIGGMGVCTVAVTIAMVSGRKIGLMQRSAMQEAISAPNIRGIVRLTYFIIRMTIGTELIGAAIMAPIFCGKFGFIKGIWYAIFHSVSAFCNAGFDLMGIRTPFVSLTEFCGEPIINIVIMCLIVWGGIGFLTWEDIWSHKWHIKKYKMQSKVILVTTLILIVVPALYFYFVEFGGSVWGAFSQKERILASFFQSITPRTAGFNTVDLNLFDGAGKAIIITLMLIGGSPGSTAGGIKTTTIAVLAASTLAVFKRNQDAHYCGRRIATETVKYASAVFIMYSMLFLLSGITISTIEQIPITECLFETASAIGTVGLSLGITAELGTLSKIILMALMYMGRVGGLTLVFATTMNYKHPQSRYPQEKITVG